MANLIVGATINAKDKVTSLEVLEQINFFRAEEKRVMGIDAYNSETGRLKQGLSGLRHDTLLSIIRDEFEEEILSQTLLEKSLPSNGGRPTKVFELTLSQAKQVLVRESKFVRKAVIAYIASLEQALLSQQPKVPTTFREALLLAAEQQAVIEEQQKLIAEQIPKALFADSVSASETSILVGDMAKLISQNGVNIGQNRLFDWLRKNNYLCSRGEMRNMPTQKSIDMGLMEIKERTVVNPDGSVRITRTPKILGKGQIYFVNKFLR